MSNLFENQSYTDTVAILLVDSSGSTKMQFGDPETTVFNKMRDVVKTLPEENFRIIFWNSNQESKSTDTNFVGGVKKFPFPIKKADINQPFAFVRTLINNGCLTFPHLAFESITPEWMANNKVSKVYFLTDGEIGYLKISNFDLSILKTKLATSIKAIFTKYFNVQLNIITVEPKIMQYDNVETLEKAAGCDVYKVIVENNLTGYISKFTSYSLNNENGFTHISKVIAPPGFVPFGENYFSELKTNDFIKYLITLISKHNQNEDQLLKIIQNLSVTLCVLVKDKPKKIVESVIKTFTNLFKGTCLDTMFVQYIINDSVQREVSGRAEVFASYRANLKNLYKQASELLFKNTKDAIGLENYFCTFPIDSKIVSGHARLVNQSTVFQNKTYPQSATTINGIVLPIFPLDFTAAKISGQCLRQWTRAVVSKMYKVDAFGDIVIYTVLGIVLKVILSDVEPEIKNAFRNLGTVMLQKARTNSETTELERLESGEAPISNSGKITDFYNIMNTVCIQLSLSLNPLTLWYAMCLSLENVALITKQLVHCESDILKDFPDLNPLSLLEKISVEKVTHFEIPIECTLDYSCLITLTDVSGEGGYQFLKHSNLSGFECNPVYVISADGYNQLVRENNCMCPICYTNLTASDFKKVGPQTLTLEGLTVFNPETTKNIFSPTFKEATQTDFVRCSSGSSSLAQNSAKSYSTTSCGPNRKGTLILMKGTVGAGKTFYSNKIKNFVELNGGACIVEGMDKYSKNGLDGKTAAENVKNGLLQSNNITNSTLVVIIDVCNEQNNAKKDIFFGVNFSGWKKLCYFPNYIKGKEEGYFAWTLRNVLQRGIVTEDSSFYLSPEKAGVNVCVDVHKKKSIAIFGKKPYNSFVSNAGFTIFGDKSEVTNSINDMAESYQTLLENQMPVEVEIANLYEKCL